MKKSSRTKSPRRTDLSGSRQPSVIIQIGLEKFSLLESVLQQSQFWIQLDGIRVASAVARTQLNIVLKPDLTVFDQNASAATDPELVEHLIDLLYDRGFHQI